MDILYSWSTGEHRNSQRILLGVSSGFKTLLKGVRENKLLNETS